MLVIGPGCSGVEIAHDLATGGAAKVLLAVRTPPTIISREGPGGLPGEWIGTALLYFPTQLGNAVARFGSRHDFGDLSEYGLPVPAVRRQKGSNEKQAGTRPSPSRRRLFLAHSSCIAVGKQIVDAWLALAQGKRRSAVLSARRATLVAAAPNALVEGTQGPVIGGRAGWSSACVLAADVPAGMHRMLGATRLGPNEVRSITAFAATLTDP